MTIEIYWDDLCEDKQKELLKLFGCNMNWDIFPLVSFEIEEDAE